MEEELVIYVGNLETGKSDISLRRPISLNGSWNINNILYEAIDWSV